ncbi:MAG: ORF6N domain-containing protein [Thermodesulfobacteriota bacterium]
MDMKNNKLIIDTKAIENRIFTIRGFQVMLDRDLSELYQVPTKRLNEQVKRNIERFLEQFRFQLTQDEKSELVANCDRFENLKHSASLPNAFTEQGVAMLSAVLRSETAVHFGASLKDLGKKWFAFSKMDIEAVEMLGKLEKLTKVKIDG